MRKRLQICAGLVLTVAMMLAGCVKSDAVSTDTGADKPAETTEDTSVTRNENGPEEITIIENGKKTEAEENVAGTAEAAEITSAEDEMTDDANPVQEIAEAPMEEETLGNPRSSYGLGSAKFLKGKNLLLSLFVTTPQSSWTQEDQLQTLDKVGKAVAYIEEQAEDYQIEAELLYDFTQYPDLKKEVETEFLIQEDVDFLDRLDEEIVLWQEEILCYEEMINKYGAEGIATMIFVNNPGISYAIVYDGTDSKKETMILFAQDYYQPGKAESATAYAHEILHVFGAHDLYEDAEFTKEVSDYVALTYPREIMYTVTQTGNGIDSVLSPVTAYHLGWIDKAEEISLFPQLIRE